MINDYIHSLLFVCKLFQSILLKFNTTCFVFTFHQIIHSRPIKPRGEGVTVVIYAPGTIMIIVRNKGAGLCSNIGLMSRKFVQSTPTLLSYYFKDDTKYTLRSFTKNVWIGNCVNQDSNLRNMSSCLKGCDEFRDRGTGQLLLYYL